MERCEPPRARRARARRRRRPLDDWQLRDVTCVTAAYGHIQTAVPPIGHENRHIGHEIQNARWLRGAGGQEPAASNDTNPPRSPRSAPPSCP